MGSRGKGNGLLDITNLDPYIYTEEERETRRQKNKELFKEIDEHQDTRRREQAQATSKKE